MSRYDDSLDDMVDDAMEERNNAIDSMKNLLTYNISELIGIENAPFLVNEKYYLSVPPYEQSSTTLCELFLHERAGQISSTLTLEHLSLKRVIEKMKNLFGEDNLKIIHTSCNSTDKIPSEIIISALDSSGQLLTFYFYKPSKIKLDDCLELKNDIIVENIIYKYSLQINHSQTYDISSLSNNLKDASIKHVALDKPSIEVIQHSQHGGLRTQVIILDNKHSEDDSDLDIHYGEDFHIFHQKLIAKMVSGDKGIVMFHGPPGTGKTNYIRRLLPIFTKNKKRVIIIPKNILEEVESPTFSTFMVSNFNNSKAVFIIEDAESIIAKRDESGSRSQVISTLLNISDGILNDLYKIQVILTFNTDLQNIDEALLRKGRLIAKHEFGHLSKETAKDLCDNLGVSVPSCELTLANIYAQKHSPDDEILLTGTPKKKKENLGF